MIQNNETPHNSARHDAGTKTYSLLEIAHKCGGLRKFAKMCDLDDRESWRHFKRVANGKTQMYAHELLSISMASGVPLAMINCGNLKLDREKRMQKKK